MKFYRVCLCPGHGSVVERGADLCDPGKLFYLFLCSLFLQSAVAGGYFTCLLMSCLLLFILSWLWTRYSLRKMVFRRTASVGRVQVGETFDERLMLDNLSVMPKLWVQIADGSTLPGHRAGYVASMGGRKRATWRARTVCKQRGRFLLGPVTATSGDPFGLFHRRITLTQPKDLLVLPHVLPISSFVLFTGGLPGVVVVRGVRYIQRPMPQIFEIIPWVML